MRVYVCDYPLVCHFLHFCMCSACICPVCVFLFVRVCFCVSVFLCVCVCFCVQIQPNSYQQSQSPMVSKHENNSRSLWPFCMMADVTWQSLMIPQHEMSFIALQPSHVRSIPLIDRSLTCASGLLHFNTKSQHYHTCWQKGGAVH